MLEYPSSILTKNGSHRVWPYKRRIHSVCEVRKHPKLVLLGQRIRELRKARGYSQESFSLETGLGRGYFGGVERGERNVAALNLIVIADELKVEVGALFPPTRDLRKLKGSKKLSGKP